MINLLKKLSKKSDHKSYKHATLIMKGGALLSVGYNHGELHSEVVAIKKLWPNKRLGTTVINIRTKKDGSIGNSYPCQDCLHLLKTAGVKKLIVYTSIGYIQERL